MRGARCLHCSYSNYCRRHSSFRLVHRDSLKPCMWINKTINVWSHLLGFLYLTLMQYWSHFHFLPEINAHPTDYLVMGTSMFCSQICMVLSSAYHIFGCQSSKRRRKWLRADLFGISTGLLGIYLSGIYTSFYYFPEVQRLYIASLVVIMAISIYIPLGGVQLPEPKLETKKICSNHEPDSCNGRRIGAVHLIYICLAMFGLYPSWHWVELHGGLSSPHVVRWLPSLVILFSLVAMAFVFYATLVPERLFPGRFDLIGCSHQWWHLLILAAMVYWHYAGISLLTYYHTTTPQLRLLFANSTTSEEEQLWASKTTNKTTGWQMNALH